MFNNVEDDFWGYYSVEEFLIDAPISIQNLFNKIEKNILDNNLNILKLPNDYFDYQLVYQNKIMEVLVEEYDGFTVLCNLNENNIYYRYAYGDGDYDDFDNIEDAISAIKEDREMWDEMFEMEKQINLNVDKYYEEKRLEDKMDIDD